MPDSQDFQGAGCNTVVEKAPDAADQKSANTFDFGALVPSADTWVCRKQPQGFANISAHCTRRSRSVLGPPLRGLTDLQRSTRGYNYR